MPDKKRPREDQPITIMYIIDTCIAPPGGPQEGGAEQQLLLLAKSLNREFFRPIIVQLIPASAEPVSVGKIDDIEFIYLPTERFYFPGGLLQLARLSVMARAKKVDIIHTFFEKAEVMGWLVKRVAGIPLWITSRRDLGFKRKRVYDHIFKFASNDCTLCIANCQAIKDKVVKQEGLVSEKVAVIHNGLDMARFRRPLNGGTLRTEIGVDKNTPLIGMVANFNFEIKGHRYFVEAAQRVLQRIPEAQFVLAGEGQLRSRYEDLARSLGIQRNFHFVGRRNDVAAILSQLDVSVLCSTSEGFSNVILESMAAGRPVVATNVGGNPELVDDGVTGYVVPPSDSGSLADALLKLLHTPGRARAMGSAARARAERGFAVEAMVKRHEQLYQSLLSEARRN